MIFLSFIKTGEEKKDEGTTAEETDTQIVDGKEARSSRDGVQLVGEDENIHLKPLDEIINKVNTPPMH